MQHGTRAYLEEQERIHGRVVHRCPPTGESFFPCCGQSPFTVPQWHRMTTGTSEVTCGKTASE